jgi:uncharacterized membrane protein YraQ (UPF0718 family)
MDLSMIWHHFVHYLRDSWLWFAGGAVVGTAVERWMPHGWAERWLTRGNAPVFTAAAAGALLPGCALTTVPVAAAFRDKGASVGALAAFLMIAPILSPHTIVLNLAMLGWPMTIGRIVLPLIVCIALGVLLNALHFRTPTTPLPKKAASCCGDEDESPAEPESTPSCCGSAGASPSRKPDCHSAGGTSFFASLGKSLRELAPYFLLGLLAVAVIETLVPHETLVRYLHGGFLAHCVAALAGIPVYVCEGAEIPLTAALVKMGVGPGPAFTFLISSVGTCIPTIAMAPRIIGWTPTVLYVAAMLVASIGGGMVLGALLR